MQTIALGSQLLLAPTVQAKNRGHKKADPKIAILDDEPTSQNATVQKPAEDEINFADYGIALTRRFRSLKIWLSVQVLGLNWFRRLVEHCCLLADYGQRLEIRGFAVSGPPLQ